jgi:hypothetical protein
MVFFSNSKILLGIKRRDKNNVERQIGLFHAKPQWPKGTAKGKKSYAWRLELSPLTWKNPSHYLFGFARNIPIQRRVAGGQSSGANRRRLSKIHVYLRRSAAKLSICL